MEPNAAAVTVAPLTDAVLRGLVLDGSGVDRALWIESGGQAVIEDAVVRDGVSAEKGGCTSVELGRHSRVGPSNT